jgi:hypothetical protein
LEPARNVRLRVGETADLQLGWPAALGVCDDTTLVRVETDKTLRLTGLAEGKTRCGFWSNPTCHTRVLVYVDVTAR